MLNLKKVAVTGGLACGKSSVCRYLEELGAYTISADDIVHQLLSSDTNIGREVIKLLGSRILTNEQIDRTLIAQVVFQEPVLLKNLENLLHPAVYEEIEKKYQEQQNKKKPPTLFVAEIPLLFESAGETNYDYTIAVIANPTISYKRLSTQSQISQEDFDKRAERQFSLIEKAKRSDYVLMNNGSPSNLQEKTKELYQELTS